jgi:hypothetical protein
MKRYTARLRLLDSQLNAAQIKAAVESELLRAPITFKVGAIAPAEGDTVLVEIASDAKRADLARMLKGVESTRRLQLECVGWGWLVTGAISKSTPRVPATEYDPYAYAQTQAEDTKEYVCNIRRLVIRQAIGCVFLLWFVAIPVMFILNMLERRFLDVVMIVIYMGLLFSGASFNPWTLLAYASRIRCDQVGIEVKFWLRPSSRRHAWTEIEGLEIGAGASDHVYTIRSGKGFLRFSTEKLNEEPTLIKTILERASLHFVEGIVGRATYRRFDAE